MFAIIDIETTGGNVKGEKITEIAIFIHDGEKIVDSYNTLINPEKSIPYNITRITGINNEMVANAPKFYEVAKKIIELTEGKIFVAHNVSFDYNFIRREYKELGYDFERPHLCTINLARQIIPGHVSYSLGKLCADYNIFIEGRHRAAGDAEATCKIFDIMIQKLPNATQHFHDKAHKALKEVKPPSVLDKLPNACGVYYLLNNKNEVIYVGKSNEIRKRVSTHIKNQSTRRTREMMAEIADVKYTLTGSELIALLKEADEIKKLKPKFNRAQRKENFNVGIFAKANKDGYLNIEIGTITKGSSPIFTYETQKEAKEHLFFIAEKYGLCQKFCGLYVTQKACFGHQIGKCDGACIGQESVENYNAKVNILIDKLSLKNDSYLLVDKGLANNEKAIIYIEKGRYQGWAYCTELPELNKEAIKKAITLYSEHRDTLNILKQFIKDKKVERIISLGE